MSKINQEQQPTLVLLSDVDGTIFHGNRSIVIENVIRFLRKTDLAEKGKREKSIDALLKNLGSDLPNVAKEPLKAFLQQAEPIDFAIAGHTLVKLQQTIAGYFPLIEYKEAGDAKQSCTALDVFRAVWKEGGVVMLLTFNAYAATTDRHCLVNPGSPEKDLVISGLTEAEAKRISIICPPSNAILPNTGIFPCEPPRGRMNMNKKGYIEYAKKICEEKNLSKCQFVFLDNEFNKVSVPGVMSVPGDEKDYGVGKHWKKAIDFIKNGTPLEQRKEQRISATSTPVFLSIQGESSPAFFSLGEGSMPRDSGSFLLNTPPVSKRTLSVGPSASTERSSSQSPVLFPTKKDSIPPDDMSDEESSTTANSSSSLSSSTTSSGSSASTSFTTS